MLACALVYRALTWSVRTAQRGLAATALVCAGVTALLTAAGVLSHSCGIQERELPGDPAAMNVTLAVGVLSLLLLLRSQVGALSVGTVAALLPRACVLLALMWRHGIRVLTPANDGLHVVYGAMAAYSPLAESVRALAVTHPSIALLGGAYVGAFLGGPKSKEDGPHTFLAGAFVACLCTVAVMGVVRG